MNTPFGSGAGIAAHFDIALGFEERPALFAARVLAAATALRCLLRSTALNAASAWRMSAWVAPTAARISLAVALPGLIFGHTFFFRFVAIPISYLGPPHASSRNRFSRNRRSGSCWASDRARSYDARASVRCPRRRSRSARAEWAKW